MTTVAPSAIRQSMAATLEAMEGWRESRWPFELIAYDPDQYVHRSFAVGLGTTSTEQGDRQRGAVLVSTQAQVRFLFRLRGDALRADYDSALDAELELVAALKASPPAHTHLVLRSCSRGVQEEAGYFVGTLTWDVLHQYAL